MNVLRRKTRVQKYLDVYVGLFLAAQIVKALAPLLRDQHENPFYSRTFSSFWRLIE